MSNTLSLGKRIRDLRMKKGFTQIELANGLCTPSMISQIEGDRARPSYKILFAIADRLGVPLEHLLKDVDLGLEHSSKYKMAMGMIRTREYRMAIPLLKELLHTPVLYVPKVDILLELATCYLELESPAEAMTFLSEVYEWALLQQEHLLLVTVLLHMSTASEQKGEYPIALYHTERALEELNKAKESDPNLRAKVLIQLAGTYEKIGKVKEAETHYEQALQLFQEDEEERGKTLLRLADACHKQKDFEKADQYATRAFLILDELVDRGQHQDWKWKYIMLTREKQDWKKSVAELLLIAEKKEQGADTDAGEVYADIALICLENDELTEAWNYAEKALLILPHTNPAVGNVHRVLAFLYLKRQDVQKAQKHLDNAINIFETHGKLAQLEEVTLQLCRHLSNDGNHREAYERLEKFHEYMMNSLSERGIVL